MFAFILILHSFQLIFMDSAVYRDFFFYICILHIFSSFILGVRMSFLHFPFFVFPLLLFFFAFCFCNPLLLQYFPVPAFLFLNSPHPYFIPVSLFFFLFQNLYIFDRHGCIYLYTWINICFQKFERFFCFLGCQLFQFIFVSLCRLFSHFSAVCRQSVVSPSSVL